MSLLTDSDHAALGRRAVVTSWRDGLPWEAGCPTCGLPWRITPAGLLARHGPRPPAAGCRGSGALVVITRASLDRPEVGP